MAANASCSTYVVPRAVDKHRWHIDRSNTNKILQTSDKFCGRNARKSVSEDRVLKRCFLWRSIKRCLPPTAQPLGPTIERLTATQSTHYLETASPSSVTDYLRLNFLPALPQASSISFSYVAAPLVWGQHVCLTSEGAFFGLCLRGCHSSRPRLLRLCCALIQCNHCYYNQNLKNLRKVLESHSLEENPILPLLRSTNGNLCLRH